ncbi:TATA-box-binding protein-like [Drosophila innubila]|uniref:TATA-box-binding protein-like n=1 Tax=Drosophila innubila TaxID=198719 RepID=UPI00148C2909|nr:TATA-box-binding protein-like [Drosophila innubila]
MQLKEENSLIVDKEPEATATATATTEVELKATDQDAEIGPELDIVINNVVCSFSVKCHLNLRLIALNGSNVEYRRENGMVTMRLRRPYTTASVWSSGRITCTGATSEPQAKVAARRFARCLSKLGFPVHFQNFRIFNVLGTCSMPWSIRIVNFSEMHRSNASYEPELHPGVTYKMIEPKATLKIFSTGSITVTAANVNIIELAIQRIYPLVHEFRNEKSRRDLKKIKQDNSLPGVSEISRPPMAGYRTPNTSWRPKMPMLPTAKMLDSPNSTPINTNNTNNTINTINDPSSSPSGSNILSNARRRATECWVNKLQNKRSRFNDANAMSKVTALARSATPNKFPMTPGLTSNVLNQSKALPFPGTATAGAGSGLPNILTTRRQLVKPTDHQVEDRIEEISNDEMDWQI